jgi:hypothetical protein
MTVRTFKQRGAVYTSSDSAANLLVKIDGQEVFNGSVSTVDMATFFQIEHGQSGYGYDLYSWQDDVSFAGTKELEVTITGGTLLLTNAVANYIFLEPESESSVPKSSGPDTFGFLYANKIDSSKTIRDPFTNVKIDGLVQTSNPTEGQFGQWYWKVLSESTFTATVTAMAGKDIS